MNSYKDAVGIHPSDIDILALAGILVVAPDHRLSPNQILFTAILVCGSEFCLSAEPILVVREKVDVDVVEHGVGDILSDLIEVEKTTTERVRAKRASPLGLAKARLADEHK